MLFIGRDILYSAKRNLLKNQAAWSGKDLKITYRKTGEAPESKGEINYLKKIADESKVFLDNQYKTEEE